MLKIIHVAAQCNFLGSWEIASLGKSLLLSTGYGAVIVPVPALPGSTVNSAKALAYSVDKDCVFEVFVYRHKPEEETGSLSQVGSAVYLTFPTPGGEYRYLESLSAPFEIAEGYVYYMLFSVAANPDGIGLQSVSFEIVPRTV
jgi:hypothetical protein